jgi:peptide/nickel transport system substrate-binding protein
MHRMTRPHDLRGPDPRTIDGAAGAPARATSRRWRALTVGVVALSAVALVASACGTEQAADGRGDAEASATEVYINETVSDDVPVVGGRVVYGVPAETSSFNPLIGSWASYSLTIARSFFDYLANYDEDGDVQPYLAERLEPSADYRTWTVTLRDGITFSNGKPVTAAAVVEGQREFKASPVVGETMARVDDWEVLDRLRFKVRANQPWSSFPHAMATQIGVVVDPDWLDSDDIAHPIGTGPFVVDRWDVNEQMVLKRNPSHWRFDDHGNRYPYLDQITFRIIVDEANRAEALRRGEIDMMMQTFATPSVKEMLAEAESGTYQAFSDKTSETPEDYVVVNTAKAPLNDVDARRALAHALDLDEYVATVTGGLDVPADSPWMEGSPWHTEVDYPSYDPVEAARLVERVKARNGGMFTVTLLGNPSNESVRVQQYLQEQWSQVGIDVRLEALLQQTKIIKMIQGDYDLALTQQFDNIHPYNELIYWQDWGKPLGAISLNFSRLTDPEVTRLAIEASGATGDEEKAAYHALSRRLAEVVPFIWLGHASRTVIAKPQLVNVVRTTLPDGQPMTSFIQGSHATYQIWLRR